MSAYQRNTAARRTQRPSSFSGTRSRNVYSSTTPSYAYGGSTSSWSPTSYSPTSSYSPSSSYGLTTYGGTASGYGGLTVPNPNSYQGSYSYLNNYGRASSPSYTPRSLSSYSPNSISKSTTFDFNLKKPASSSSLSLKSTGSEGYAVSGRCR